jgi:hypothetical protein
MRSRFADITPTGRRVVVVGALASVSALAWPSGDLRIATAWLVLTTLLVLTGAVLVEGRWLRGLAATVFGLVPAVSVTTLLHDSLPAAPTPLLSRVLLLLSWVIGTATLGRLAARHIEEHVGWRRAAGVWAGVGAVTTYFAFPLIRLLLPSTPVVARLAWTLGEEDNAHIMGIAREVLVNGPSAGQLATEIGTGFVTLAIAVLRTAGWAVGDPRLAAITVFTLSALGAVLVLGLSLAVLQTVLASSRRPPTIVSVALLTLGAAIATYIGLSVAVTLPMRTGFISFVWAMAWLALGVAPTALLATSHTWIERSAVLLHVVACVLMLISSWTFLIGGFAAVLLVTAGWVPWRGLARVLRRRWLPTVAGIGVVLALLVPYFERSLIRQVLILGRDALTTMASGIVFDRFILWLVIGALVAGPAILLARAGQGSSAERSTVASSRVGLTLLAFGPTVGVGLSWIGIWLLAQVLTGGELNYAGWKLAYGFVAMGALLAVGALTAVSTDAPVPLRLVVVASLAVTLVMSDTVATTRTWYERTAISEPPHAVTVVTALESGSPDLPIRCLPQPGTRATPSARMAAYYCARWVEDAFNEDRFHGHRFTFLETPEDSFDEAVRIALERDPSRYTFAYPMTTGPGWFGWDGVS